MPTDPHLQLVTELITAGQVDEAKHSITQLLRGYSENADAWYLAASLMEDPEAQKRALQHTLNLNPNHDQARQALNELLVASGQKPLKRPSRPSAIFSASNYIETGIVARNHHDNLGAISAFSKAIRIDPKATEAYVLRGTIHEEMDALEDAISDYHQALQLNPEHPQAMAMRTLVENAEKPDWQEYRIGMNLCNRSDISRALEHFDKAIRMDGKVAAYYVGRAKAFQDSGDLTSALNDLDKAVKLEPKSPEILLTRGKARALKGDINGAINDLSQAIKLGEKATAYFERGKIECMRENFKAALNDFSQVIQLDPESALAFSYRGIARLGLKDRQGAYEDYLAAIAFNPNQQEASGLLIKIEQMRIQENKGRKR
jgi:tetratricopeptide (TPR) repeat protein